MPTDDQALRAELDRQDRDGIGCTVCGTRYHATSVDLDAWCPVCKARAERDSARLCNDEALRQRDRLAADLEHNVEALRVVMEDGKREEDRLREIIGNLYVQRGAEPNNLRTAIRRAFRDAFPEQFPVTNQADPKEPQS